MFLKLAEKLLPKIFMGSVELFKSEKELLYFSGETKFKKRPSNSTVEFLRNTKYIEYEYKFYYFILERFEKQVKDYL